VNQGGEPGHDDYGLPRVEIQVPDDARELYRDVQAYHRELRALRRQERSRRWRVPLRQSGLVLPIIAGCLVLAMLAGMVLTMFSANPYFSVVTAPRDGTPRATQHASSPSAGSSKAAGAAIATATGAASRIPPLPAKTIVVSRSKPVWLRGLKATALVIVPAKCGCSDLIRRFLAQARSAGLPVYLIGSRGSSITALNNMAPASSNGTAILAIDTHNALKQAYQPRGLEVLLVDSRGEVTVGPKLRPGFKLEQRLKNLSPPS
jgi:hypothetical protein